MAPEVTLTGVTGELLVQDRTVRIVSRKNAKYLYPDIYCILSQRKAAKYYDPKKAFGCKGTLQRDPTIFSGRLYLYQSGRTGV